MKLNVELRGHGIPSSQRELVERLRDQAFEIQRRFATAEQSALLLDQMLDPQAGIAAAINTSYEAHAFEALKLQLFRILVVDLWACVLDPDNRSGSVRSIFEQLRRDDESALEAVKAYYADTTCLEVTVTGPDDDSEITERRKAELIREFVEEQTQAIDREWASVDTGSSILTGDASKRLRWARHKLIAHFDKTDNGLVAFDDDPPYGEGKLTWGEPFAFLETVRPYVYQVFLLITANHWGEDFTNLSKFYAASFWDRFKNGSTDLKPDV